MARPRCSRNEPNRLRSDVERVRPGFSTVCAGAALRRKEMLFDQGVTARAAPETTSRCRKSRRSVDLFMAELCARAVRGRKLALLVGPTDPPVPVLGEQVEVQVLHGVLT